MYWPFTADGQYNCKSGYKFLKDLEVNPEVSTQLEVDKKVWKSIWSLEVPNKYKNLVWCACRNSLPTKQNLVQRTIIQNPSCDQCSLQAEDPLHTLWSYLGLDEVWEGDRWSFQLREQFANFKELCGWIIENGKLMDLFSIQVWSIWNQRNKLRINHACCLTKALQQSAEDSWNEIRRCNLKPDRISSKPQINWIAPSPNTYKINYDGAISNADNKSRIGVIVRDY